MGGTCWRAIPRLDAPGVVQMAIDRWLFEQHDRGAMPPVLRFYTWSEPTISLGFHQRRYPEAWERLRWRDRPVPLVRRPTGGRAVLHGGDLTYAVIGSGFGGRRETYCRLCQFLVAGWRSLGLPLQFGQERSTELRTQANCFALATGADLVQSGGEKFIGSAQYWRGSTVLQHGSMAIAPDRDLYQAVFGRVLPPWPGPAQTIPQIIEALTTAAVETLDIELETQPLSDREWAEIQAEIPPEIDPGTQPKI